MGENRGRLQLYRIHSCSILDFCANTANGGRGVSNAQEEQQAHALALLERGVELHEEGRYHGAISCLDEAIVAYEGLLHEEGALITAQTQESALNDSSLAVVIARVARIGDGLGSAQMSRAASFFQLDELEEAGISYDNAIEGYKFLLEHDHPEFTEALALVLTRGGDILLRQRRFEPAISYCDWAIALYQQLLRDGRLDLAPTLGIALANKATALLSTGGSEEALGCVETIVGMYAWLVEDMEAAEYALPLAWSIKRKGSLLQSLGRPAEAIEVLDEGITLARSILDQGFSSGAAEILSATLTDRGLALADVGRYVEAVEGYDSALALCDQIAEQEESGAADTRAITLMNKASALLWAGQLDAAHLCGEAAISYCRELVNSGRMGVAETLMKALGNQANVLDRLGALDEALAYHDEALLKARELVSTGRADLEPSVADGLMNKGNTLDQLGRTDEALASYGDATGHLRRLYGELRSPATGANLARVLRNQAVSFMRRAEWRSALPYLDESADTWRALVDSGHAYLLAELIQSLGFRVLVHFQTRNWQDAGADIGDVMERFVRADLMPDVTQDPVALALNQILTEIGDLEPSERQHLYAALGVWKEQVRSLVDSGHPAAGPA
jgi:tetratricopeptide (TPR) repeat protein